MLQPGLRATVEEIVTEDRTAEHVGSGDVPVYATPMVLALVERAAVAAVSEALEEGTTTVGAHVELDHTTPTPLGAKVMATATLTAVEGRKLRFAFAVTDPGGPIARGTHLRFVVDRKRFLETARSRT